MIFLIDHNLERHALILSGNLSNQGWVDFLTIRFVTLEDLALSNVPIVGCVSEA